jgi:anti-sigma regulatory factor (Ser/Thr protein kinase)
MKELSLHILDIANNSIRAGAEYIFILVEEAIVQNQFKITIQDNGMGMSKEMVSLIKDPFCTTRKLRRIGLGIPLFYQTCKASNGDLIIESEQRKGTKVMARMEYNHMDRPPLGDIASTIIGLITSYKEKNIEYEHWVNDKSFGISSKAIKNILGEDLDFYQVQVYKRLSDYIKESITSLY